MSEELETKEEGAVSPAKKKKPPIAILLVGALVIAGAFYGIRSYLYGQSHVSTDDAYITTDVVPVSARVAGNVVDVKAEDNQLVRKGDILVQLDASTYQADYDQAAANLALAEANARSANVEVGLTARTAEAQETQARGGVQVSASDIGTAQANVERAISGVSTARATLASAQAQARATEQGIAAAEGARERLAQAVRASQAQVNSAQAAVRVAQANLANAQATSANAQRDAARYRTLANEGAVPQATAEQRETAAANASASVEAAREQVQAAQSGVAQAQANLAGAQQQLRDADISIRQARANASATREAAAAQAARVREASTEVSAASQAVQAAQARQQQAQGALHGASTVPQKVSISEASKQTALARVKVARAALENARVALERTRVRAPISGRVSRRNVQLGQQVTPGQPMLSIVPAERPWVVANFKETQLGSIRPGQHVEIEVDAYPGRTFSAHVDSISAGTGATFALLPPDNATGNFTKVVQRVPVKIVFDEGQAEAAKLVAGASANVSITIKS